MTGENIHHLPRLGIAGAMRIFGLTARALRFYEERGLVEARRDRLNARYYDHAARVRLQWISRLRRAGVGLSEIEDVLNAQDEADGGRACAMKVIEKRREALAAELAAVDAVMAELSTVTEPSNGAARRYGQRG